jgi:hypothetical protein
MPPSTEHRFKTLDFISGFGLFKEFNWDSAKLKDFDRYNVSV